MGVEPRIASGAVRFSLGRSTTEQDVDQAVGYIAAQEGVAPPESGGHVELPSLAVANEAIKARLGWAPAFPTYRSGLAG